MNPTPADERYLEYMNAIRNRVCSVCLDSRDDKTCSLTNRVCAIEGHLPRLVSALSSVESTRMEDYAQAIRGQVCTVCLEQKDDGTCDLRDKAGCSLDSYLSLVLDAVEEVNERRRVRGVSLG